MEGNPNGMNNNDNNNNNNKSIQTPSVVITDKEKYNEDDTGKMVSFFSLFRFSEPLDYLFMIIGSIGALANGVTWPAISIVFGRLMNLFSPEAFKDPDFDFMKELSESTLYLVYIGIGVFVCSYFEITFWVMAGERQSIRCRKEYFRSILRQEIGWYDISKSSELSSRMSGDSILFQDAIGEKVGHFLYHCSTLVTGYTVGLVYGWQLVLVMLALTPLYLVTGGIMAKKMTTLTKETLESYAKAGSIAEEKIGSIRTIVSFSGEQREIDRYSSNLKDALNIGIRKGIWNAIGMGLVFFVLYGTYSLSFWYGAKLIVDKAWNPFPMRGWVGGDVMIVFFSVVHGSTSLSQLSPTLTTFISGRAAAFKIFQIIDRKSKIDSFSIDGRKDIEIQGNIEFKNIHFTYPSRKDVKIFNNFNLQIKHGQTVALAGGSGGGKSTIISLLERFYDPDQGEVLIDGINIKEINVRHLRKQISLVSQEPTLFATSIAENIRYGKYDATMDEVIEVCKIANAHEFISALPDGYDTQVGEKGIQMSGGQKQRIAIARAMIKNPKILLLDESTSALDVESERLVQEALDRVMKGRTTIVIAHRLSTIQNSDVIAIVKSGQIVEQGSHQYLLDKNGHYSDLIKIQNNSNDDLSIPNNSIKDTKDNNIVHLESILSNTNNMEIFEIEDRNGKNLKESKKSNNVPFKRILSLNKQEWPYFVFGCFGALITGAIQPCFAIILSEILKIFLEVDSEEVKKGAVMMSIWFILLATAAGLGNFIQVYSFSTIGEKLTFRLRLLSFKSIMKQDIGWFEIPENSTGKLTNSLATDSTLVQGMTSQRLGLVVQNFVTTIAGLVIALVTGWKLSLVVISTVPIIAFAGKVEMDFSQGFSKKNKNAFGDSSQVATEAINGTRTIISFTCEDKVISKFDECLKKPLSVAKKQANISGIALGFSKATLFFIYALTWWYGGKLVDEQFWKASQSTLDTYCSTDLKLEEFNFSSQEQCIRTYNSIEGFGLMLRIFFAIILCAGAIGNSTAFAPDFAKAKVATNDIFKILDRQSKIDSSKNKGIIPENGTFKGDIEFNSVKFSYPSRPDKIVYNDFSLKIPAGSKCGLVGFSGGGKSTVISLLERFYDPLEGTITIDGIDIKDYNLNWLRSNFGPVGQEPFLFSGTIIDNIRYGKSDATIDEVIEAAKSANAHNFISALPDGYNTQLGDKYTQLSGGQKQRVAIARAIIRNPKILLLDEATSALDGESQRLVQDALDVLMKGRTSIIIAHRLSTIIDSDLIAVVKSGKVIEQGSHQELLSQSDSHYQKLVARQL